MKPINTVIIRHPKERLKKCSLEPLRKRSDLIFYKSSSSFKFQATGYVQLTVDSPPLSADDQGKPLLLLDSTWQLLPDLEEKIMGNPTKRSLPSNIQTAFPRKSKLFNDPKNGLASVEALYVALKILGNQDSSLLDHYYWKDQFLAQF